MLKRTFARSSPQLTNRSCVPAPRSGGEGASLYDRMRTPTHSPHGALREAGGDGENRNKSR